MEPNKDMSLENKKSFIALENRKKMTLDGDMDIRGEELKMTKLDVQNGDVVITGKISYVVYTSEEKRPKKRNSIVSKIFR